jgi:hypothetical protein
MKTLKRPLLVGLIGFLLAVGVGGCGKPFIRTDPVQYTGLSEEQKTGPNPDAPVIKQAYAIDRGMYGTVLKIYLEAEDPKGDLDKIVTQVHQSGYGNYFPDIINLKPQYKKSFKGFIQWNTYSSKASSMDDWIWITVSVYVVNKKGFASNVFEFPFTFETGTGKAPNPPAPFDQGNLPKIGSVSIDLYNPFRMGGGDGNFD